MKEFRILTLNSGSSSLKFSTYLIGEGTEKLVFQGKLDRIGSRDGKGSLKVEDAEGKTLAQEDVALDDHAKAVGVLIERLPSWSDKKPDAVGHRIVQGGPHHWGPERVTPELIKELKVLGPLDPPHLPAALAGVEQVRKSQPNIPQVVCFDTSFHRTLPPVAQRLPLPRQLAEDQQLLRFGFHGLSYEFIVGELNHIAGPTVAQGKLIIAHLGNGASMAAVKEGRSVETTMGFTPAGGLVMGSRSGDLDPGVLEFLLREGKVSIKELAHFIYQECGLKGVSELSADIRDLIEAGSSNPKAQEALDLFSYQARKMMGSLVAALDGVETIVFTGGIGENVPRVRAAICAGMHHLGLRIATATNESHAPVISTPDSTVTVRVMKTNEERVIARHTARLLSSL